MGTSSEASAFKLAIDQIPKGNISMDTNACDNLMNVISMLEKDNPKHPALPQLRETLMLLCGKA